MPANNPLIMTDGPFPGYYWWGTIICYDLLVLAHLQLPARAFATPWIPAVFASAMANL